MKPTRCTSHSATLIDHVVSNSKADFFESVILTTKISDHFPTLYFCKDNLPPVTSKIIKYRDFSDANFKKFSAALRSLNWDVLSSYDSTQDSYDYFSETFFTLYNLHFPLLSKKLNKNVHGFHPWMTKGLLISRCKKIFLCKTSIKNPSVNTISMYKNYRNLYAKVIRVSKNYIMSSNFPNINQIAKKLGRFCVKPLITQTKVIILLKILL